MNEESGTLGKAVATGGLLITVCCAPLVATPVVALFAAGGAGFASAGQIGLGIAALGTIGGYLYLRRRADLSRAGSCGCDQVGGCSGSSARSQAQFERKG